MGRLLFMLLRGGNRASSLGQAVRMGEAVRTGAGGGKQRMGQAVRMAGGGGVGWGRGRG